MPRSANDLIDIPATLWQRPAMIEALKQRDIGRVFQLVAQYTGSSQTQIGIACILSQGKVSDIERGVQRVQELEVYERIANGLRMPPAARIALGLAPGEPVSPLPLIPSRDGASPIATSQMSPARTVRQTTGRRTQCGDERS